MPKLIHPAALMVLLVVVVMFGPVAGVDGQGKSDNTALPPELSLYAGSKSCIECHKKFYQLWATSRHGPF